MARPSRKRREKSVKVILSCAKCERRELWWVPIGILRLGRCTCPCGAQMHEEGTDHVAADVAWEAA